MKHPKLYSRCCILALTALVIVSCDIYHPQKSFRIAVPKTDYTVNSMFTPVKSLLEQNGYKITVIYTDRNIDANRLVARGEADLAFINNVSSHIVDSLGPEAGTLRTVIPLAKRALLAFTRSSTEGQDVRQLFDHKTIAIEILNGEGHRNIAHLFARAHIYPAKFVQRDQSEFDVRMFWGSPYGKRAQDMLDTGWHAISFPNDWIDFQTLSEPALEPLSLPALPGDPHATTVHTVASDVVLVTCKNVGENAIYQLAQTIVQGKMSLVKDDPMFRSITESINTETLLCPLHEGTSSYLRRDTPAFIERYADSLALVLSMTVLLYGVVQAVKARIAKIKKDRIDEYFLEFLDIRSQKNLSNHEQEQKLNDLFHRALIQMTHEKMDKNDFHIFSRLIQQELTNLTLHA